jgi:hypothetical protein
MEKRRGFIPFQGGRFPRNKIAEGRNASISAGQRSLLIAWHEQGKILVKSSRNSKSQQVSEGRYPILKSLNDQESFLVWENKGEIFGKLVK